jgi:hypothetical protein
VTDKELFALFIPILNTGLTAQGYTGVIVRQSYVPTQFGAQSAPTLYCVKIHDHRYGSLGAQFNYDTVGAQENLTETQFMETSFQIQGWVIQDPTNLTIPTASDLTNAAAFILASAASRATLKQNNVGILRISEVANPYFIDDKSRFEASPTFDFTLTHRSIVNSVVPSTNEFDLQITGI